ncbi:hypothetical protein JK182_09100 [Acetobacter okinawensis]|uniref:hypothetical protein n=1 Tax=Acetobacter okinawensis TaxID=1076594 RepID=UPI001BA76883|nr:hypothetical protein [Acetobacter okinawensis]MBS0988818.1 hypothetical protein [Acetobacter okinawensis]
MLAANGFPKGSGWDQISEKLKDKSVAAKANYAGLKASLRELLIVNDKNIRVCKLKNADATALRDKISVACINQNSVFATHFPLPVPDNILHGMPEQAPIPVAKFQCDGVVGVLFSSIMVVEQRETIHAGRAGKALAADYETIIGIKKVKIQTFDALMMSKKTNYLYVLTDAHQDQSQTARIGLQSSMAEAINNFAGSKVVNACANLFPTIQPLYDSDSGFVKTLSWATTTSSGKYEWMRGGGVCLREEIAHKAAIGALGGGFKIYGIELEWGLDEVMGYTPRPMLSVVGVYRMLYETKPHLGDATVWGCASLNEFEFILKELMVHVSGKKTI